MKTYYPGEDLPNGYYWLYANDCEDPWVIEDVYDNKVKDFRHDYIYRWDENVSKAIGPLIPPV